MLDAFIIEELKRKERQHDQDAGRPQPQLPVPTPGESEDDSGDGGHPRQSNDDKPQRGVVIIDYSV